MLGANRLDRLHFHRVRRIAPLAADVSQDASDLFILEDGVINPLGEIPGTIEDIRWTNDGSALIVLAAKSRMPNNLC